MNQIQTEDGLTEINQVNLKLIQTEDLKDSEFNYPVPLALNQLDLNDD